MNWWPKYSGWMVQAILHPDFQDIRTWLPMAVARTLVASIQVFMATTVLAQSVPPRVIDVPTRPGVTQRFLFMAPENARAAVVLFSGGNGGLGIESSGMIDRGGNFLVRSRQLFADQGFAVAVIDAPSDRQSPLFLSGFRQTPEHLADIKAVIAWLHQSVKERPVWLVGTSRGTQSVAAIATNLGGTADSPDGIVLTSTILTDRQGRPVPEMPLGKLTIPVLVVHHEQDGCRYCAFRDIPALMNKLTKASRKDLQTYTGGVDLGDPCEAQSYHGFNGLEKEVVTNITTWISRGSTTP